MRVRGKLFYWTHVFNEILKYFYKFLLEYFNFSFKNKFSRFFFMLSLSSYSGSLEQNGRILDVFIISFTNIKF